jgi:transcriptional regulator with XRE-family HTH domain
MPDADSNADKKVHALRAFRLSRGMTQEQFAKMIGWSVASLSHAETGKYAPKDRLVCKLAKAAQVPVEEAQRLCRG